MLTTVVHDTRSLGFKAVKATSIGILGMAAIAISSIAKPVTAAPVTVDFEGNVTATVTSDDDFAALLADFGILIPDGAINENIFGTVTVDDDANQYLDGDLSLGYDLLSNTLGVPVDQDTIELLDSIFDLSVTGSGRVTAGATTMDYNLRFNSDVDEFQAVFDDFDPNTEIISACASGECDWVGDFNISLDLTGLPAPLLGSLGSFAFTTNAEAGGTIGEVEISNHEVTVSYEDGDLDLSKNPNPDAQAVPEPSTLLGVTLFFGIGATLKKKNAA